MNLLPTWRYRICSRLVSPLIVIHWLWRSVRDGHWRYFRQRLGFFQADSQARIHIHAASVGEVITVLPLIEQLQLANNPPAFLVTTNTPTGASILSERLKGSATHAYLPIDFAGATKRFFSRFNITSVWLVETEIWPWLFSRAKQSNIPLVIINARLGHKSQSLIAQFFDQTYRRALSDVMVLARSDEDAKRFAAQGANPNLITSLGNLKFAATPASDTQACLIDRDYVLAASTHDNEELALAKAWLRSAVDALLVIAPRHPERGTRLLKELSALQMQTNPELPAPARRSSGQHPGPTCKLYLADTLGELQNLYAHSSASFVGGSLTTRGGHNVLEPARLGRPIIVGPHTHNFSDEITLLKASDAIEIAKNADDIVKFLTRSISNDTKIASMGHRASTVVRTHNDVIEKYSDALTQFLSND